MKFQKLRQHWSKLMFLSMIQTDDPRGSNCVKCSIDKTNCELHPRPEIELETTSECPFLFCLREDKLVGNFHALMFTENGQMADMESFDDFMTYQPYTRVNTNENAQRKTKKGLKTIDPKIIKDPIEHFLKMCLTDKSFENSTGVSNQLMLRKLVKKIFSFDTNPKIIMNSENVVYLIQSRFQGVRFVSIENFSGPTDEIIPRKYYFPESYCHPSQFGYVGPWPDVAYFKKKTQSSKVLKMIEEWYETISKDGYWDFMDQMKFYLWHECKRLAEISIEILDLFHEVQECLNKEFRVNYQPIFVFGYVTVQGLLYNLNNTFSLKPRNDVYAIPHGELGVPSNNCSR